MIRLFCLFVLMLVGQAASTAQSAPEICSQLLKSGFPNSQSLKWFKPYLLDRVEGQTVFAPLLQKWDSATMGVCVAVFSRDDGRLVAAVASQFGGQFQFAQLEPGRYTLVATVNGDQLQQIVIPIRLVKDLRKNVRGQRLSLHLRLKEDQRKSFVTVTKYPALREELLRMVAQDQAIRHELIKADADRPPESLQRRMAEIDARNLQRMKAILKRYGWPVPETVGVDGVEAGFLIVQHGDHAFQKRVLPLARRAFQTGKLQGPDYALLLDRVLVGEGKPQIYGTQARVFAEWKDKQPALYPIEDEANVDQRRATVGLGPLADYVKGLQHQYFPQDKR